MHRSMSARLRATSLLVIAMFASGFTHAQGVPTTDRDKVGYAIGMDVGRSIAPAVPDMDLPAFQRAVENALASGQPLLDEAAAKATANTLMASINARNSGGAKPAIDRNKVGLLVGRDVGRSLVDLRTEFDVPMFLLGLKSVTEPAAKPALDDADMRAILSALSGRLMAAQQSKAMERATSNLKAGQVFLTQNKSAKGVFSTPSGLQYMVLRQGNGPRPKPGQKVRVSYEGKLLDGTVFDSSYKRGQPAEFGLNQVIPGWTEGVGLMPVGAKYRFWIPAALGYGEEGAGNDIPPNSTLTFDVELLGIL